MQNLMKKRMNGINRGRLQATDIYLTIKLSQDIRYVIHKWKTVAKHKYFQKVDCIMKLDT